ncbi:protein argonaute 14-like [Mustela putorius furo]|uniref:Protein argonaute 14-like n=1 Tax=Mustela putorius furo TaxID=9669 RepID=A0A8U0UVU5_MUSPF|nr:protein argonaute 14-like [Mustela putorius furo]
MAAEVFSTTITEENVDNHLLSLHVGFLTHKIMPLRCRDLSAVQDADEVPETGFGRVKARVGDGSTHLAGWFSPRRKGCPGARPRGPVGVRARFSRAPAGGARGGRSAARTRGEPARGAEGEERRGWRGRGLLRVPPGRRASLSAGSEAGGRRGSRRRRRRWRAAGAGAWLWLRVLGDKMAAALWRLVSSSSPLSSAPPLAASSVSSSSSSLAASSSSCSSPSDRRSAGPLSRSSGGG